MERIVPPKLSVTKTISTLNLEVPSKWEEVQNFVSKASKTKGFILEPIFNWKSPQETSKKNEAVSLYATSEVKMKARFEILMKFWTKYCFALLRDAVWRKNEIP